MSWEPAVTLNDDIKLQAVIELQRGFLDPLSRMRRGGSETYALWHYPEGQFETYARQSLSNYLQCAGTASAMSVELRQTHDDGTHTHWTLGRSAPTGSASETIEFHGHALQVHPEEVWTAEQAAPLFEQYAATRTIPDDVHRRVMDI